MADVQKIALVTGSSRGIGRGIAERLSRDGFHVVASATARGKRGAGALLRRAGGCGGLHRP